jgi:hypothetical protein
LFRHGARLPGTTTRSYFQNAMHSSGWRGSTPSGDDFLGGLLFAVKILQAAYPNSNFINYGIPIETYHYGRI